MIPRAVWLAFLASTGRRAPVWFPTRAAALDYVRGNAESGRVVRYVVDATMLLPNERVEEEVES